ncbi:MAG: hypothetical protein GY870_15040 [archaeon]|nr:hypothetical protein [archaeon]
MAKTGLKVTGLSKTKKKLKNFEKLLKKGDKSFFLEAGKVGVKIIKDRTEKSKDVNNRKFKKYSDAYAEKKKSTHVNLKVKNKMLGALSFQTLMKKVRFYIKKKSYGGKKKLNTFNRAIVHNFGAKIRHGKKSYSQKHLKKKDKYLPVTKIPQREFMGFTSVELKRLYKIIRKNVKKKSKEIFRKS